MSLIRVKQIDSGELFSFVDDVFSSEIQSLQTDVDFLLSYSSGISGYAVDLQNQINILSGDVVDLTNSLTGIDANVEIVSGLVTDLGLELDSLSGYIDLVSGIAFSFSGIAQDAYDLSQETSAALLNTGAIIDILSGKINTLSGYIVSTSGSLFDVSGRLNSLSGSYTGFTGALGVTGPKILGRESGAGQVSGISIGRGLEISGGYIQLASGVPVRDFIYQSSATGSVSTTMPLDNTIPQSGEGGEIISVQYTPALENSKIFIEFDTYVSTSVAISMGYAIFLDTGVDAVSAKAQHMTAAGVSEHIELSYLYTNTTTGVKTFKVRIGPSTAATLYYNRLSTGGLFGVASLMTMKFREYFG